MAITWSLNLSPTTGAIAMYNLKSALVSAGWTVPRSSDGTTYNSSGDQITSGGTGTGGLGNASSWFVIQMPTTGRQLCIQRGSDTNWWIKYSFSAGFTGGSPNATTTPTATDGYNILGTTSSGSSLFPTNNTYRQQIMADGSSPYGFYSVTWPNGGGNINSFILVDPLTSTPSDADPYLFVASSSTANGQVTQLMPVTGSSYSANNTFAREDIAQSGAHGLACGYLKKGLAGEGFVTLCAATYHIASAGSVALFIPGNAGVNPNTTYDDQYPVIIGRGNNTVGSGAAASSPTGYKGTTTLLKWIGTNRVTGDLLSVSSTGDRLVINGAATLPWQSGTAVTL